MKNALQVSFIFSFFMGVTLLNQAQVKIESKHMPSNGDTLRYSNAAASTFDFTKTGKNHNWDFSKLTHTNQSVDEYKRSSSTPYIFNFGFTSIGLKIADTIGAGQTQTRDVYAFYKNSTSKWEAVGVGFIFGSFPLPQAGKHSNSEIIYSFPLEYNKTFTDSFQVAIPIKLAIIEVGKFYQTGRRTSVVDGEGLITTPYGENINCIRIKSTINQNDSIAISTPELNFTIPNNRVEYEWLSPDVEGTVLKVTGTQIGNTFIPSQVRYRDKYRSAISFPALEAKFKASKVNGVQWEEITLTSESTGFVTENLWEISPNTYEFVGGTRASDEVVKVKFNKTGQYDVKLTVSNFTAESSFTEEDYITIGVSGVQELLPSELGITNPVNDQIIISKLRFLEPLKYEIFDVQGRLIGAGKIDENNLEISVSEIESGYFFLHLYSQTTQIKLKLLKN